MYQNLLEIKTCQYLGVLNVHHITAESETDSLIMQMYSNNLGRLKENIIYKPTPEPKTSYSFTQKSTPHNIN